MILFRYMFDVSQTSKIISGRWKIFSDDKNCTLLGKINNDAFFWTDSKIVLFFVQLLIKLCGDF